MSVAADAVPASVMAFRTAPGLEVAWESEGGQLERLWLRGFSDSQEEALRAVPTARRVRATAEGLLEVRPDGSAARLPYRKTPVLRWQPATEALSVTLPDVHAIASPPVEAIRWRLIASSQTHSTTALLTSAAHLSALHSRISDFAKTAPLVRLERLRFCWVGECALVMGTPLPPLPGDAFWGEEHLRPVGLDFEHPKLLGRLSPKPYGARPGDVTLWRADGSYVWLPGRAFVMLGRDNVGFARAAPVSAASSTPPPLPS